jgi:subtilisin family serine protease
MSVISCRVGSRAFPRRFRDACALAVSVSLVLLPVYPAPAVAAGKQLSLAAVQPTFDSHYVGKTVKSQLGQIAQSDPALLNRTDGTPVNVIVKLDYDSVSSYGGNIPGYAATSPGKTGKKLKQNQAAVAAYTAYATTYESQVLSNVRSKVAGAKIRQSFRNVYGGVSMTLPANRIADLLAVDGVVAVQQDKLEQPLTDATPAFLTADQVWTILGGKSGTGYKTAGQGVIVGVLDTGIWPEHPSFADQGLKPLSTGPYPCTFGITGAGDNDPAFACQNKLVGAYAFLDTYIAVNGSAPGEHCTGGGVCSARDADGHGTHTSSTAAGGPVDNATLLGVNRGHISGMAPGAQVIMYRVCLTLGCYQSDSVNAVQQAIIDGVDVINFSISGGTTPYTDAVELAFLDAYQAGVFVSASAGNSGPGAGTAAHGGPWVNTVGASTSNRFFLSTLHLTANGGAMLDLPGGVTVTAGVAVPTDIVLASAPPYSNNLCLNPAAPGTFTGKIVACQRGTNARVDKGYNVLQGGAVGMILFNPVVQDQESDNHWLPAIHIDGPAGAQMLAFIGGNAGVKATWANGTATMVQGDVMAAFSSRGPLGDFIKPDVTAPGVQILAGMTPAPVPTDITVGPPGQLFQAIAGTSMSSPHSAGVAALVRAVHPTWTPGQVKSALMTSSVQDTVKEDGVTPADPFDRGAGAIRALPAVNAVVTFDVLPADYIASATDPLGRVNLNLPSIDATTMPGQLTTYRTMHNVSKGPQTLSVSTTAPAGVQIIVASKPKGSAPASNSDQNIQVPQNADVPLQITIKAPSVANGQYFGQITLTPQTGGKNAGPPVVMPVAFVKQQGVVTLSHSCAPPTFPRASQSHCTVQAQNFSGTAANTSIEVDPSSTFLGYTNVSSPGVLVGGGKNASMITWSGTLNGTTPPVIGIVNCPGCSPAGAYLPLSLFGITPIAGVGDETITNFNVPSFLFGGEVYSKIGVVSDGYVVIGGGTSADIAFINQNLPDPTRPNNVIAPFWTDLNPGAGGAVRIGTLTDGSGDNWIVIDYAAVKEYSTSKTNTFEIWIQYLGSPAEGAWIDYGTINGNGDGGLLTVGAENRSGDRGGMIYYNGVGTLPSNGTGLAITSSPPGLGGMVQFTYDALGKKTGVYSTTANMTSNVTPGTTQVVQPLTVTP